MGLEELHVRVLFCVKNLLFFCVIATPAEIVISFSLSSLNSAELVIVVKIMCTFEHAFL